MAETSILPNGHAPQEAGESEKERFARADKPIEKQTRISIHLVSYVMSPLISARVRGFYESNGAS